MNAELAGLTGHIAPNPTKRRSSLMTIKDIYIKNLRGLRDFKMEGARTFNLLVGPSELGKTTVLEGIAIATSVFDSCIRVNRLRGASINNEFDARSALETLFHKLSPEPIRLGLRVNSDICSGDYMLNKSIVAESINRTVSYKEASLDEKIHANSKTLLENFNGLRAKTTISENIEGEVIHKALLDKDGFEHKPVEIAKPLRIKRDGSFFDMKKLELSNLAEESHTYFLPHNNVATAIKIATKYKKKDFIIKALRRINPSIADFALSEDPQPLVDIGLSKMVPIHILGDGAKSILSTLGHLCHPAIKIYLIDELALGLYYRSQPALLKSMMLMAKQENKQIFATTHNADILLALKQILDEEESLREDAVCFSFLRDKEGNIKAIPYDYEGIRHGIENDLEIR